MSKWFQFILDNPEKGWDYWGLSKNPNITWEIVKKHPEFNWNYYGLSSNPNITWEIIKMNPEKPWDYQGLSMNPMEKYQFPLSIMKKRVNERIEIIKEELVAKAWHPSRVEKWLECGMDIEDC